MPWGVRRRGRLGTVGVVGELAPAALAEVGDGSGDRHAPLTEQAGVVHDDEQPLRHDLPVGAAELGDVGVHGELLTREQDVGVDDRRHHDVAIVQRAGSVEKARVVEEALDAGRRYRIAVRVGLAEVVGAGREHRHVLAGPPEPPTGADEVHGGVVALRQLGRELGREPLVAVEAVAGEAVPHVDDGGGLVGREQRVEDDGRCHGENAT